MTQESMASEDLNEMNDELEAELEAELKVAMEGGSVSADIPIDVAETPADELAQLHLKNTCPVCSGRISIGDRAFECDERCGWIVWRDLAEHHISQKEIELILSSGKSEAIHDFVSMKGNGFSAFLKLAAIEVGEDGTNKVPEKALVFELTDRPVEYFGDCPKCKGGVVARGNGEKRLYLCSNALNIEGRQPTCDFRLFGTQFGKELTERTIRKLITCKPTELLKGFVSKKSGKSFDAMLTMDKNGRVSMEFPSRRKNNQD